LFGKTAINPYVRGYRLGCDLVITGRHFDKAEEIDLISQDDVVKEVVSVAPIAKRAPIHHV
jgi:hypothetical protein